MRPGSAPAASLREIMARAARGSLPVAGGKTAPRVGFREPLRRAAHTSTSSRPTVSASWVRPPSNCMCGTADPILPPTGRAKPKWSGPSVVSNAERLRLGWQEMDEDPVLTDLRAARLRKLRAQEDIRLLVL